MARIRLETLANVLVSVVAVLVGAVVVRREFGTPSKQAQVPSWRQVSGWEAFRDDSIAVTRGTPFGVRVIAFVDLECPFCAEHNEMFEKKLATDSSQLSYSFVHLPLAIHRFAMPAAKAAECAGAQGRFFEFTSAVMRGRDSLGLKSWAGYGAEAAVPDTVELSRCAGLRSSFPRIERGVNLAKRLGINSTPTVLVEGALFTPPPTLERLMSIVDSAIAERRKRQTPSTTTGARR